MRIACGVDLVEDTRVAMLSSNAIFLEKLLQPREKRLLHKLPSIFALKEAVIKALELPTESWLDIEIDYKENGKTIVTLSDTVRPKDLMSIDSSVSHSGGVTVGQVVILCGE